MTLLQEQLIIIPFLFFFLEGIVFFQSVPFGGFAWDALTSPPPSTNVTLDVWSSFSIIPSYFGWIIMKIVGVFAFLFGILLMPFSLMSAWGIWGAAIHIPLVTVFLIATLTKIFPWIIDALKFVVDLIIGIAQAIAEAIPF